MSPRRDDLLTVQALRGIAALLVVAYHVIVQWAPHFGDRSADEIWGNGSAGVDIFFVISGLVMTISTSRVAGRPDAAWVFLRQRVTRIVPLYWVATTAKIAAVLALPVLATRTQLDPLYVIGSYLLLPVPDWLGQYSPVLPVGWTLTFEMLFYLLVAFALAVRMPILRIATPPLLLFAALAVFPSESADTFYNTIVLEFLYGVGIGILWGAQRGPLQARRAAEAGVRGAASRLIRLEYGAAILLVGGFAAILLVPEISGSWRPLTWGVPAACIVAGAVVLEPRLRPRLPAFLLSAGDASYAIYLTHGFVVPLVFVLIARADLSAGLSLAVMFVGALLISSLVGQATHVWLEKPMLRWLRRRPAATSIATAG
jgi:exopolysaccharide production protein ExoZ